MKFRSSSAMPISIPFDHPANFEELARCIGVDESLFKLATQLNKAAVFTQHQIPKKNKRRSGEHRIVWEAPYSLADIYKSFARRFDLFARSVNPRFPHPCAYGYIRGRSTVDNARCHCAAPQVLHADIESFFPSITSARIKNMFISMGVKENPADILTEFLTINHTLPLGLPSSPLLANLVCLKLDDAFQEMAEKRACLYTRYADDITISGRADLPTKEQVEEVLKENGFSLSQHKFRITKPGQAHYVTGLSITDTTPRIPRSLKKRLRQEVFYCKKYGIKKHIEHINKEEECDLQSDINRIDGMIRYISHVEPHMFGNVRKEWIELLKEQKLRVSYAPIPKSRIEHFTFYVDECEIQHNGKTLLVLSLVKVKGEDVEKIEATTKSVLRKHMIDPFSGGQKGSLEKRGLHYSDSNEDLRKNYTDHLITFPLRAYLVYGALNSPKDYAKLYLALLERVLPDRLMSCDGNAIKIIIEENSKIKEPRLRGKIKDIYQSLEKSRNRRPIEVGVVVGKKSEHPCFSMPDYLLGVFSNYATLSKEEKGDRKAMFFEKLRDKYRVVLDANTGGFFSRKRPFTPWGW